MGDAILAGFTGFGFRCPRPRPRGAGLSEEMYDDGFRNIENIDISKVVIEQMEEKYKDREMTCAFESWPSLRASPPAPPLSALALRGRCP